MYYKHTEIILTEKSWNQDVFLNNIHKLELVNQRRKAGMFWNRQRPARSRVYNCEKIYLFN